MRKLLLAAEAVMGMSGSAIATDGNYLFAKCDGLQQNTSNIEDAGRWNWCIGYIIGAFETNQGRYDVAELFNKIGCPDDDERCPRETIIWCVDIPDGFSHQQVVDIVHLYLANNPAVRHENASFLVTEALKAAWPYQ